MSKTSEPRSLTLDRRLLEHPNGLHIRRMGPAIWLYLVLLAEMPPHETTLEIVPASVAKRMGLPEGTIQSWLGHLRKARYLEARRMNGGIRVHFSTPRSRPLCEPAGAPARAFTAAKLAGALGHRGGSDHDGLEHVLRGHSDATIRKALARTLAIPSEKIRRSRTALFLYLLKQYAHEEEHEHYSRS